MRNIFALTSLGYLMVVALPVAAGARAHYQVAIDTTSGPIMRVRLAVSKAHASPVTLFSPASRVGIIPQVRDVRCDGMELKNENDRWQVPAGCRVVTWNVPLVQEGSDGILADQQQSVAMTSGWYIFSDISSLLRQLPEPQEAPLISFKGPKIRSATFSLRSLDSPPSYLILGTAPRKIVHDGKLRLTYVGNDLETVRHRIDPAKHLIGLNYFRRIIGPKNSRETAELTVVWLPVPNSRKAYGAAAGHDTLLANYLVDPGPDERFPPLVGILHEQFHQIETGKNLPGWVRESLAQYYALKAFLRESGNDADAAATWDSWFQQAAESEGKLLDAQRRVRAKDFSRYDLFYTRGSLFWRDVDAALQRAGQRDGLDSILPAILNASFPSDASLPPEVVTALSAIPDAELKALISANL